MSITALDVAKSLQTHFDALAVAGDSDADSISRQDLVAVCCAADESGAGPRNAAQVLLQVPAVFNAIGDGLIKRKDVDRAIENWTTQPTYWAEQMAQVDLAVPVKASQPFRDALAAKAQVELNAVRGGAAALEAQLRHENAQLSQALTESRGEVGRLGQALAQTTERQRELSRAAAFNNLLVRRAEASRRYSSGSAQFDLTVAGTDAPNLQISFPVRTGWCADHDEVELSGSIRADQSLVFEISNRRGNWRYPVWVAAAGDAQAVAASSVAALSGFLQNAGVTVWQAGTRVCLRYPKNFL